MAFFLIVAGSTWASLAIAEIPNRVWVDFDPACGYRAYTDVDDCYALVALLRQPDIDLAGISLIFGNAKLPDISTIANRLLTHIADADIEIPPVFIGSHQAGLSPSPASAAIKVALREGPLTVLALGPLTNLANAIHDEPSLAGNINRIIAVMGKREGHIFHPAEGSTRGIFGHGPIFSDLNFKKDRDAVEFLLHLGIPFTFTPYELGRQLEITQADLESLSSANTLGEWLANTSEGWLDYWHKVVGRNGFYPFDLMATFVLLEPQLFDCPRQIARITQQKIFPHIPISESTLLVSDVEGTQYQSVFEVNYCDSFDRPAQWSPMDYFR